jgi:beta-ribofuranosylaminobenzene 5'-phosphate synthase
MKIYVKTSARLHLGLIDLNGGLGRIFGGLGVAIDNPTVVIETERAHEFKVNGEMAELTQKLASQFLDAYGLKEKVAIEVKQVIPAHIGLGSGTQLALAVAASISRLFNLEGSIHEFAVAMGRTAQSGVGTAAFEEGGFVVDGGRNIKDSSRQIIPLIYRQPFPEEWSFVVATPNVKKGLANEAEASALKKLPPMPAYDVGNICRLTMMKLLPAVAEKDIKSFGEALTKIQCIVGDGFAQAQGGRYSSSASTKCIEFMLENGVYGAGQSSWGPTVYGLVRSDEAQKTLAKVEAFLCKSVGGEVFVARANNRGAIIKVIR